MKILFLLLLPVFSLAQPPKKSSKVKVVLADTIGAFNRLTLALFDKGYSFENKDEQLKIIATNERPVNKYAASSKIRARITDSILVLQGSIALDVEMKLFGTKMERTFSSVQYIGAKKSQMREAWNELEEIARMFGSVVRYE